MGLDCNHMTTPDTEDDAAGFGVIAGNGWQPRRMAEPRAEEAPEYPDQAGLPAHWGAYDDHIDIDQGETLASRRRPDPYRVSGGPAGHSYNLI